jgi:hypothetical protein
MEDFCGETRWCGKRGEELTLRLAPASWPYSNAISSGCCPPCAAEQIFTIAHPTQEKRGCYISTTIVAEWISSVHVWFWKPFWVCSY